MRKSDLAGERGKRGPAVETAVGLLGRVAGLPAGEQLRAAAEVLQMMGFTPTPEVEARKRVPAPQAVPGKRTVTLHPAGEPASDCCGAELETAGTVTRYYVCTRCEMPCDARASLNTAFLDNLSLARGQAREKRDKVADSRKDSKGPWHRWSYGEEPRRATERYCLFCGIECRRESAGASWTKDIQAKPRGGEWTLVPSLPECTSAGQSVRHYKWAGTGT